MQTITAAQLREIADAAELDFDDVRVSYSGRGMFGERCVGFVHVGAATAIGAGLGAVLGLDATKRLRAASDSMGRSTITYFPGLQLAEGDTWDAED